MLPDDPDYPIPVIRKLRPRILGTVSERSEGNVDAGLKAETSADLSLEQLPYCLAAAIAAVEEFDTAQREILNSKLAAGGSAPRPLLIENHERNRLSFAVDHYLDAARRTQNALIRICAWR
jgi:hypothetical protein